MLLALGLLGGCGGSEQPADPALAASAQAYAAQVVAALERGEPVTGEDYLVQQVQVTDDLTWRLVPSPSPRTYGLQLETLLGSRLLILNYDEGSWQVRR